MPIPWNDDPPGSPVTIAANVAALGRDLLAQARTRVDPVLGLARDWHRAIYQGVPLPVPYYTGEFRATDPRFPQLTGYDVIVGGQLGVGSSDVPSQLAAFEQAMRSVAGSLDAAIPAGSPPASGPELAAVIQFAASAHGEWVRIHPFANGNGRTARCWANFVALRYGMPDFVTIKPRPADLLYAQAAHDSMRGDHTTTEVLFRGMLRQAVGP
jgi:fido (protein-threonine AMPylation protein)